MRELWRVTAPNGRLIVVVPRRGGLWSRFDNTPFGWGNPYSKSQLERLLRDHSFTPERWRDALYMMPSQRSLMLKSTRFFERAGRMFGPTLGRRDHRLGAKAAVPGGAASQAGRALCARAGAVAAGGDGNPAAR